MPVRYNLGPITDLPDGGRLVVDVKDATGSHPSNAHIRLRAIAVLEEDGSIYVEL